MSGSTLFDSIGVVESLAPLRLTVHGGGCDGRTVTVRSETCVVGSAEDCNLRLAASAPEYVCEFVRGVDETTVRSRSSNVRLNGKTFDEAPALPGDRISIGDVEVVVEDLRSTSKNRKAQSDRRRIFGAAGTGDLRSARLDGALLLGELRRLQQELRDATDGTTVRPQARRPKPDQVQETAQQSTQLADSLRTLLESERGETEILRGRLEASHREREELERRVAELDDALQQASERLTEIAEQREQAEQEKADAARASAEAVRAEIDSLRGMLGDAQDELEQMRRVYDARLARAEELAEEERLAAVTRAIQETEERFVVERARFADLEAERVASLQERLAELEAQLSTLPEFESQIAMLTERLVEVERDAEKRLAVAVAEAKHETERRLAGEMQECVAEELQVAQVELTEQRSRLDRERRDFAEMQLRWDAERSEYERLAAEQTSLIAEKQRELRDAQERLAAAERTHAEAPASSYVDVDRQAWEEEKAAFEETARTRMDELAEKARQVEDRLRAAAEKQRREIQEEREALVREREENLRKSSRPPRLSQYFERTSHDRSNEEVSREELPEPTFEAAYSEPACEIEPVNSPTSYFAQEEEQEEREEPRRAGFRFFGDLNDAPVDSTIAIQAEPQAAVVDDCPQVDAEEAERLRQIAEDRLARFAPRPDRHEEAAEESTPPHGDYETPVEGPSVEAPVSGFLLRDFLNRDESSHEADDSTPTQHEPLRDAFAPRESETPSSVADVLAKFGHSMPAEDDLAASVEEHSFDEPSRSPYLEEPTFAAPVHAEPSHGGHGNGGHAHGEHEEDSIEDYMQSLLRRVRGESAAQLVEPAPQDVRKTTMMRQTALGVPEPEPEPVVEEQHVVPLTASEFTPRSEAPEQTERLSAMRALANESARSAIFSSAVRKTYAKALTTATLSVVSALLGVGAMWFGAQGNLMVVGAGLLAWALAGFWGFRAWKTWKELRKLAGPLNG